MKVWGAYAATALGVSALGAFAAAALLPASAAAVWTGAGVALSVQLVAFALLVLLAGRDQLFLVGWLGGMLLRFAAVGVMAFWLTKSAALPRDAALVSLVGFVFLLLLLEPLFLRRTLSTS